jgi:hypothetical protein
VDVVANDTDADGDTLTLQSVGTAAHGSVSIVGGKAQYSPEPNFNGSDSFNYVVSDGFGGTANGTVNVTINPVNDAPTANNQTIQTNGNTPANIVLTGSDLETDAANLNFVITAGPSHGSLSGSGANRTYTPALNYSGPDSFKFRVTDTGDGAAPPLTSAEATVSITVNDTIKPTITAPANVNVGTGAGATNCSALVTESSLGVATASDNSGNVSISRTGVPAGNIFPVGTTTITYTATDGAGNTAQATQTVTVVDNTPPTVTAPAPVTATADSNGQGIVPNFVSGLVAQDNCGPFTATQTPLAGTTVGLGTTTVTIRVQDQAGNVTIVTTTFTVQAPNTGGPISFTLDVNPPQAKRGKIIKLRVGYNNGSVNQRSVTLVLRYSGDCGVVNIGNFPMVIAAGAHGTNSINYDIPMDACFGTQTLTLDVFENGVKIDTKNTTFGVIP